MPDATLPPEELSRICQDVAHGIARALLGQVQQIVEDIRCQNKDHSELIERQERALQHLLSRVGTLPAGNRQAEASSTFVCGLCKNVTDTSNDYPNELLSEQQPVLQDSDWVARTDNKRHALLDEAGWAEPQDQLQSKRKRRGAPREVQQWVAEQLAVQIDKLVPASEPEYLTAPPPDDTPRFDSRSNSQEDNKNVWIQANASQPYSGGNVQAKKKNPQLSPRDPTVSASSASNSNGERDDSFYLSSNHNGGMNPSLRPCGGDDDDDQFDGCASALPDSSSPRPDSNSPRPDNRTGSLNERIKARQSSYKRNSEAEALALEQHRLFGDMGMDKTQLDKEEYNVAQFYHDRGCAQWIARSEEFGNLTLVIIFLNAVYIGYDADQNDKENLLKADLQFRIMENLFCVFFFFEWLVRFFAFKHKFDCIKDMWFKFDTLLVGMMVVETWIFPVAFSGGTGIPSGLVKLVRLLRLARMARIMRAFPDLVAMIKGVKVASRAVSSALLMLVGLVYVFAIIMFTLLKDETDDKVAERFRRLGITMWTLLIDGTFLDGIGFVSRSLMDTNHYFPMVVLLVFVLLSALTVMNMLIGVLCEVVAAVAAAEKEDSAIRMVKDKLLSLLRELDEDGSGMISRSEVDNVMNNDTALNVLESLQVDVTHLLDHLDMFFEQDGELTIHQIMDLILMLRGDRPPTMKDMLHGQTFSRWKTGLALDDVKKLLVSVSNRVSIAPMGPLLGAI